MARSGLSHLDLKPDNFVFDDDWRLMLIDFGHCTIYNQPTQSLTGTPNYCAPEVLRRSVAPYIPCQVDIFNLGVILFIIKFQSVPFRSATAQDPFFRYVNNDDFNGFFTAHNANGFDLEDLKVIWACIQYQPMNRPSISNLLSHPLARLSNQLITDV